MDSSEEWGKTNDSLWQFCDAMDISRFERFGLSDSTLFRLDALRHEHVTATARVLKAGKKQKKGLGRMVTDVAAGVALAKEGWDLIVYHGDAWLMQVAIRQGIDGIKAGVSAKAKGKGR